MLALFLGGREASAGKPVVLELFTSQGCSSCPPADELLDRLANDPSLIALSFHIDYWDYLGWKDPYSFPAATERQRSYAKVLGGGVFTPQLVVDGNTSIVGSREADVLSAIERARLSSPIADVAFSKSAVENEIIVDVSSRRTGNVNVLLVYFLPNSMTDVRTGENRGRHLVSRNAVTDIRHLGLLEKGNMQYRLPLPRGTGAAVIVQEAGPGAVLGAGVLTGPLP